MEQIISCAAIKKKWPSEVGGKIFGVPKGSRSREPVMCQAPYPPAHHICNVSRNGAPWQFTDVMCWEGMGLGTLLVRARANFLVLQKISPPLRSAIFFFWLEDFVQLISCSTNATGNEEVVCGEEKYFLNT